MGFCCTLLAQSHYPCLCRIAVLPVLMYLTCNATCTAEKLDELLEAARRKARTELARNAEVQHCDQLIMPAVQPAAPLSQSAQL